MFLRYYPKYFAAIQEDLGRLGIDVEVSKINTGHSVHTNASVLRDEVKMLAQRSQKQWRAIGRSSDDTSTDHGARRGSSSPQHVRKVAIYGHSKGAIDGAMAE